MRSLSPIPNYDPTTFRLDGIQQGGLSVAYGYLPNSNLLSTVTSAHSGVSLVRALGYDAADQLTSAVNSVGSSTMSANGTQSSPMLYDPAGRRTHIPREDGSQWVYGYNSRGEVTSGGKQLGGGAAMLGYQFGYQFDQIGNRTQATVNGRAANYVPNDLNQYTQRTVPGAVDITGSATPQAAVTVNDTPTQRQNGLFYIQLSATNTQAPVLVSATTVGVRRNAALDGKDVVTQNSGKLYLPQTPEQYAYDADGNLKQDGRWTYTWDAENRLIQMQSIASVPAAAKMQLTFAYDWQGRRIDKKVYLWNPSTNSYSNQPSTETKFIYDGWNVIAETDGALNPIGTYLWGQDLSGSLQGAGGVGGLLAVMQSGANAGSYLYAYDANGNILGLVNNQSASVATYEYGPFGEVVRSSGPLAGVNPFGFSTKYIDAENGLDYYGLRYYNPSTGRWISRDPIEETGGLNIYSIVANNPLDKVDPIGLSSVTKQGFLQALDAAKAVMHKKCFCCDSKNVAKCSSEADSIVSTIENVVNTNFGKGTNTGSDNVGGYLCWDWANAFANGASKLNLTEWTVSAQMFYAQSRSMAFP
jgi:RHS repeat-associated protein